MTLYYITITGVNRKLPQPQSATRLPPPEGGGLRSGAVHAIGCNVLADNSWPEVHGLQGLAIDEQNLAPACGPRVCATFEAGVANGTDFGKFFHRQALFRSAEKILHPRHGF
jgi:hypothetical protein